MLVAPTTPNNIIQIPNAKKKTNHKEKKMYRSRHNHTNNNDYISCNEDKIIGDQRLANLSLSWSSCDARSSSFQHFYSKIYMCTIRNGKNRLKCSNCIHGLMTTIFPSHFLQVTLFEYIVDKIVFFWIMWMSSWWIVIS